MKINVSLKVCFLILVICLLHTTLFAQDDLLPDAKKDINLELTFKFKVEEGSISKMRVVILIPNDVKDRQTVNKISLSVNPDSLISDRGNAYAVFYLHNVPDRFEIKLNADLTIYKHISEVNTDTSINFAPYLAAEKFIETNSPEIIKTAATLKQKTDIETVISTYDFVKEHVSYKMKKAIGAEAVLESGLGKCTDFSDLFVALLRANKIPAKIVRGMTVTDDYPFHEWAEAYLKKQGWVLFDPTTTHTSIYKEGTNYTIVEKNKYIVLSEKRIDNVLHCEDGGHFYYRYWGSYGCKVSSKMKWNITKK